MAKRPDGTLPRGGRAHGGEEQRRIQDRLDRKERERKQARRGKEQRRGAGRRAPGAGAAVPAQHLEKPGSEAVLEPAAVRGARLRGSGKLRDMVAIVTGGDSGIGRAVAVLFAREGADVAIVYLDEHDDAEETKRCVEAEGRRCVLIAGRRARTRRSAAGRRATRREFGRLDMLVNNAAFQEHARSLEDLTDERFDETMRTNIYGYFHMAKRRAAAHEDRRRRSSTPAR